jgi:hypothetical protein
VDKKAIIEPYIANCVIIMALSGHLIILGYKNNSKSASEYG